MMTHTPLEVDKQGLLVGADFIPSPNCDDRPPGTEVTLVVVHAISLPPNEFGGDGVARLFTNTLDPAVHPYYATIEGLRVSAHVFIRRDGSIVQFVSCDRRAWHAGVSSWMGRERCNDFSIGIELEGCDELPFEMPQYEALGRVIEALATRYPLRHVAGHEHIAPGRKTDPGPCFEWSRLSDLLSSTGTSLVVSVQR